jgi:hypothetical protein
MFGRKTYATINEAADSAIANQQNIATIEGLSQTTRFKNRFS